MAFIPARVLAPWLATALALAGTGAALTTPAADASPDAASTTANASKTQAVAGERARQQRAAPGRGVLLLSPFGPVPVPDNEPADPDARTQARQYIARWQAQEMEGLFGGAVVWATIGCCDSTELDLAEGLVHGDMAARDLPSDTPVFADGTDARLAARLVDRLSARGLTRVLLIVQ